MLITHLTSSTFFGGPERQILGLADHLRPGYQSQILSFPEGGQCQSFVDTARQRECSARALLYDTPRFARAIRELSSVLVETRTSVLCCHGYKASLLGRIAARRTGVPVLAVSRGWTSQNVKVQMYELLDRLNLHWMDKIVCVSRAQARKVMAAGVARPRIAVIYNAIDARRFHTTPAIALQKLRELFSNPPQVIIGAIGRLSPEKGFDLFVRAAVQLVATHRSVGFVHFGHGPLFDKLRRLIDGNNAAGRIVLAGCRSDVDQMLPGLTATILPSYTEGLPNAVLESMAAEVPVVATRVGGTPELVLDGENGILIPPGDVDMLCEAVGSMLESPDKRRHMGKNGKELVQQRFTFARQARCYRDLIEQLPRRAAPAR